jgi:hypothetical protein
LSDYLDISLVDARREYLANSTTAMPIGGVIAWASLAIAAYFSGTQLPSFVPLVAAAAPVPIALAIDLARGELGYWKLGQKNPVKQLFLRFITVVGLIIPFVILAAQEAKSLDLLILGLAILAGMIWVPHGWGADDPAGFIHFAARAVVCYIAYIFSPEAIRGVAVAGAAALTYVYAILAMRKPSSVR